MKNYTDDSYAGCSSVTFDNKKALLKSMGIWKKLSNIELNRIEMDDFPSGIARDNFVHSLIMKYL